MLLLFVAFAYLFVGLAHTVSCTDETVTSLISMGGAFGNVSDEGSSKKSPLVAQHCYVCAPVLMPALIPMAVPSARSVKVALIVPKVLRATQPWADTPPPKYLT
ncbi:hypothetical protein [Nitrobacter hamburgensis]|nr:hypothetical protein [Nitrobacter hamburgensis]